MKGFLFIPEMAVATLRDVDPKTNTRRVMVPQPVPKPGEPGCFWWAGAPAVVGMMIETDSAASFCDYKVGEVRCLLTTWAVASQFDDKKPTELSPRISSERLWHAGLGTPKPNWAGKSRPGRFLPNSLRHLMPVFEIISVRAERVQEISPADCRAEGMPVANNDVGVRYAFGQLWNSINEKRGYGWVKNPWVWRVEFKRISP